MRTALLALDVITKALMVVLNQRILRNNKWKMVVNEITKKYYVLKLINKQEKHIAWINKKSNYLDK
jgi:hypothetical protein